MAARNTVVNAKKAVVAISIITTNSELSVGSLQRQVGEGLGLAAVGRYQ